MLLFYPKIYVNTIKDISHELLIKNNIKAIILDMDNIMKKEFCNTFKIIRENFKNPKREDYVFCL